MVIFGVCCLGVCVFGLKVFFGLKVLAQSFGLSFLLMSLVYIIDQLLIDGKINGKYQITKQPVPKLMFIWALIRGVNLGRCLCYNGSFSLK